MQLSERWFEMDLYWFQGDTPKNKAHELFERVEPMIVKGCEQRKGISLCVGWLFDSVLYWNNDLSEVIKTCQAPTYQPWTYHDLKLLLSALRAEALARNIENFNCSLSLLGGETMAYDADNTCEGWSGRTQEIKERAHYNIDGHWFYRHPEINKEKYGIFDYTARVNPDSQDAFFADETPTFSEYFGVKLATMCKAVGFNAVVLRDAVFTPSYIRGAATRYKPFDQTQQITQMFISTFSRIKQLYKDFIIVGYNSGTSAMEQLRSHGFDLETIAKSGFLDLWITQTWASAWQDYWPAHSMGYTFQLQSLLAESAMLANTPCKHLFLLETFDAWEPWDSIHMYPDKVYWEMQAYGHACVIGQGDTPKYSDGCYVSWLNRGSELIPESTVRFIADSLGDLETDLQKAPVPLAPCIIYHREGLIENLRVGGEVSRGEEFDDWCAMLQKYGSPILSIVRSENLAVTSCKQYIFPAPAKFDDILDQAIISKSMGGTSFAFLGGVDTLSVSVKEHFKLKNSEIITECRPAAAHINQKYHELAKTSALVINQRRHSMLASEDWQTIVSCLGGTILAQNNTVGALVWETPEWGSPKALHLTNESIQSPQLYNLVSKILCENHEFSLDNGDWQKPICFLAWEYDDKKVTVMLANLETGVTGNSQFACKGVLNHPEQYKIVQSEKYPLGKLYSDRNGICNLAVAPHKTSVVLLCGEV